MSIKKLTDQYASLFGKDFLVALAKSTNVGNKKNYFYRYAKERGAKQCCRYTLMPQFEYCGLFSKHTPSGGMFPLLHQAMNRSISKVLNYNIPALNYGTLFAFSPYKSFGAEVVRVEGGHLVLITPTTLSFCFLLAILAVTSMQAVGGLATVEKTSASEAELSKYWQWAHNSHNALNIMIKEFCAYGRVFKPLEIVKRAQINLLHPIYFERIQSTYENFIDFLFLHESAHIYLGHISSIDEIKRSSPTTGKDYVAIKPAPQQEEDADELALKMLVGKDYYSEMSLFCDLLENDPKSPKLNKLWSGHSAYGRYISALFMLKAFDLIEYHHVSNPTFGINFSDQCEINGTHPSGQHRFTRVFAQQNELFSNQDGMAVNLKALLRWSNWAGLFCSGGANNKELQKQLLQA